MRAGDAGKKVILTGGAGLAAGGAGERSARAEASWAGVRVREPGRGSAAGLARSCVWAAARAGQRGRGEAGLRGVREDRA